MKTLNEYYTNRKIKNNNFTFGLSQIRLEYILINIIKLNNIKNILELGTGIGKSLLYLSQKYKDINFYGIEINKEQVTLLNKYILNNNISNLKIIQGDATNYQSNIKFDFIFSEQVIEHVENQNGLIKSIYNNLTSSGQYFISCPNYNFPIEQHINIPIIPILNKKTAIKMLDFLGLKKKKEYYKYIYPININKLEILIEHNQLNLNYISNKIPTKYFSNNKISQLLIKIFGFFGLYKLLFPWIGIIGHKN